MDLKFIAGFSGSAMCRKQKTVQVALNGFLLQILNADIQTLPAKCLLPEAIRLPAPAH
jgi:hypothetical protein